MAENLQLRAIYIGWRLKDTVSSLLYCRNRVVKNGLL